MDYICLDCLNTFDELIKVDSFEQYGYFSPCCSGAYAYSANCDICGEYITDDYIKTKNNQIICEECFTRHNIAD